jgi:hypothetical protein
MKIATACVAILLVALLAGGIVLMRPEDPERLSTTSLADSVCPRGVPWNDIAAPTGNLVVVYGPVVSTDFASDKLGKPTFLDLGKAYPEDGRVSVVIPGRYRDRFAEAPEDYYRDLHVCVRGKLDFYGGALVIFVKGPDAITVIGNEGTEGT